MGEILSALSTMISYVWNTLFEFNLLPNAAFKIKTIYKFTWIALIFAELFRTIIFDRICQYFDDEEGNFYSGDGL